jgi:hypothetical protein
MLGVAPFAKMFENILILNLSSTLNTLAHHNLQRVKGKSLFGSFCDKNRNQPEIGMKWAKTRRKTKVWYIILRV